MRSLQTLAGFVDDLGYLQCVTCGFEKKGHRIYRGSTHANETCDCCGQVAEDWPDRPIPDSEAFKQFKRDFEEKNVR